MMDTVLDVLPFLLKLVLPLVVVGLLVVGGIWLWHLGGAVLYLRLGGFVLLVVGMVYWDSIPGKVFLVSLALTLVGFWLGWSWLGLAGLIVLNVILGFVALLGQVF